MLARSIYAFIVAALAARPGQPRRWNFHKYLLDRAAQPLAVFDSVLEPVDTQVISQIEKLLALR